MWLFIRILLALFLVLVTAYASMSPKILVVLSTCVWAVVILVFAGLYCIFFPQKIDSMRARIKSWKLKLEVADISLLGIGVSISSFFVIAPLLEFAYSEGPSYYNINPVFLGFSLTDLFIIFDVLPMLMIMFSLGVFCTLFPNAVIKFVSKQSRTPAHKIGTSLLQLTLIIVGISSIYFYCIYYYLGPPPLG